MNQPIEDTLTYLFPGQGSQYIDMGRVLYEKYPIFADTVDTIDRYCKQEFGISVRDAIYPKTPSDEAVEKINTIMYTQLTIFTIEMAMYNLLSTFSVQPKYVIGHSFGELAALVAAGVWDMETGFKAVAARVKSLKTLGEKVPGKMISVTGDLPQAQSLINLVGGRLQLCNQNLANQVVLGGEQADVEKAAQIAEIVGIEAQILPIEGAFHSDLLQPAVDEFYKYLRELPCNQPHAHVLSTIDGQFYKSEEINSEALARKISTQLVTPINFPREIQTLDQNQVVSYIEVGPKWTLSTFVKNILTPETPLTIPTIHPKVGDKEMFTRALSNFLVHGIGDPGSILRGKSRPIAFDSGFISFVQSKNQELWDQLKSLHNQYKESASDTMQSEPPSPSQSPASPPQPVSAPAQPSTPPTAPSQKASIQTDVSSDEVENHIREKIADKTGYPEEMLEPDLDLEVDLGIDTVKQAEIWMELGKDYDIQASGEVKLKDYNTIRKLMEFILASTGNAGTTSAPVPEASEQSIPSKTPVQEQPEAPTTEQAAAPSGDVEAHVRLKIADKTGYPEEMLESDLDLEADLGIDTVKQAEIWMELGKEYHIESGSNVQLKDYNTIRKLASFISTQKGGSGSTPAPASVPTTQAAPSPSTGGTGSAAAPDEIEGKIRAKIADKTGYPEEMLEPDLDLEADLGIDTVKQAEIWMELGKDFSIEANGEVKLKDYNTIKKLADFVLSNIGGTATSNTPAAPPPPSTAPTGSNTSTQEGASTVATATAAPADLDSVEKHIRNKIAEKTGYPEEMLESDLDLEADLGIDTVKQAEIWMELGKDFSIEATGDVQLKDYNTIRKLADYIAQAGGGDKKKTSSVTAVPPTAPAEVASLAYQPQIPEKVTRFQIDVVPATDEDLQTYQPRQVIIINAGESPPEPFTQWAATQSIDIQVIPFDKMKHYPASLKVETLQRADTIVFAPHLSHSFSDEHTMNVTELVNDYIRLSNFFATFYEDLKAFRSRWIIPIQMDGQFGKSTQRFSTPLGSYPVGFFKSLQHELPNLTIQNIDMGTSSLYDVLPKLLQQGIPKFEAGYINEHFHKIVVREVPNPTTFYAPVHENEVVLVTGGGRGIVFECVAEMAKYTRCQLVLTGRTPLPAQEEPYFSYNREQMDAFFKEYQMEQFKKHKKTPVQIKQEFKQFETARELHQNMVRLKEMGIQASYHTVDVSSGEDLMDFIREVERTKGPIKGVIHGAGVEKSAKVADKNKKDIQLTLETKLIPLRVFFETLNWDQVTLFIQFGSVAGSFGNEGQTDYALANDLLTCSSHYLKARYPHILSKTISWTGWKGTGMVSPDAARFLESIGIVLIEPQEGIQHFMKCIGSDWDQCETVVSNEIPTFKNVRFFLTSPEHANAPSAVPKAIPRVAMIKDQPQPGLFFNDFALKQDPWLDEHRVWGTPVVPGTFILEMFSEAVFASQGNHYPVHLSNVYFRRPLKVDQPIKVAVQLISKGSQTHTIRIVPADKLDKPEMILNNLSYTEGIYQEHTPFPLTTEQTGGIPDSVKAELDSEHRNGNLQFIYQAMKDNPDLVLQTRDVFWGVKGYVREGNTAYALIELNHTGWGDELYQDQFVYNPFMADMAVQVGAFLSYDLNDVIAIPYKIEDAAFYPEPYSKLGYIRCDLLKQEETTYLLNIYIYNETGVLVGVLHHFTLHSVS